MNKKEQIAEQIAKKHLGKKNWQRYGTLQKQGVIAAIVEAIDSSNKELKKERNFFYEQNTELSKRLLDVMAQKWNILEAANVLSKFSETWGNEWFSNEDWVKIKAAQEVIQRQRVRKHKSPIIKELLNEIKEEENKSGIRWVKASERSVIK